MSLILTSHPPMEDGGSDEEALVLRDLSVAYGRRLILKDVSAEIHRGQVVGVIGPNGGGKSTLLKAIVGIIPVLSGTISVFGRSGSSMRSRMAYVPQREAVDWEFPVTVQDVSDGTLPGDAGPTSPTADHEITLEVLDRVGMSAYRNAQTTAVRRPAAASVARALAQEATFSCSTSLDRHRRRHPGSRPSDHRGAKRRRTHSLARDSRPSQRLQHL
jgi:manganese/zinc/iron transport system ATP- binding protein